MFITGYAIYFRPLIGVNFCKPLEERHLMVGSAQIFVPLSGLTSVNIMIIIIRIKNDSSFSSPYRG